MSGYERKFTPVSGDEIARRRKLRDEMDEMTRTVLDRVLVAGALEGTASGKMNPTLLKGADPNARDGTHHLTASMWTVLNNHMEGLWMLLEAGADQFAPSPVIIRHGAFLSAGESGPAEPGDVPLTAPLMAVICKNPVAINMYHEAGLAVPDAHKPVFREFGRRIDAGLESAGAAIRVMPHLERLLAPAPK